MCIGGRSIKFQRSKLRRIRMHVKPLVPVTLTDQCAYGI